MIYYILKYTYQAIQYTYINESDQWTYSLDFYDVL